VRVVSINQPNALLITLGRKKILTRPQNMVLELPAIVAIHSTKVWDSRSYKDCRADPYRSILKEYGIFVKKKREEGLLFDGIKPNYFRFGCILGIARIVDCCILGLNKYNREWAKKWVTPEERGMDNFYPGRYCFLFDEAYKFDEPIPHIVPFNRNSSLETPEALREKADSMEKVFQQGFLLRKLPCDFYDEPVHQYSI